MAREIIKRKGVLVYNFCYHGTVDETYISITEGVPELRRGNLSPPVNSVETTRVVQFNVHEVLEDTLNPEDVAYVLAQSVMTNIGIIYPDPGYHDALREITKLTGILLIIDETHTICTSPGVYTQAYNLKPDFLAPGKPIAGGVPAAVYCITQEIDDRFQSKLNNF